MSGGAVVWAAMAAAGGAGACGRLAVDHAVTRRWPTRFPWGILVVNLTGCAVLGLLVGAGLDGDALRIVGVGLIGGYTTFSTWMVQTERLLDVGALAAAVVNWAGALVAGVAVTAVAWWAGSLLG